MFISDLDGTLITRSISVDFLYWLNKKGLVKQPDVENWVLEDHYLNNRYHVKLINILYKELIGVNYSTLVQLGNQFIAEYDSWCSKTPAFDFIDKPNTIVISGSPDFLVKAFCKHYGIKQGYGCCLYLDSNNRVTGARIKTYDDVAKSLIIESLIEVGLLEIHSKELIGLGDSIFDKGIFDYTNEAYLVNPSKETLDWYKHNCKYYKEIKLIGASNNSK
jgi:phosphoserine phosphatase